MSVGNVRHPVVAPPVEIRQRRDARTLAGAGLIFVAGQIHLVLIPEHFQGAPYLGLLFAANFIGLLFIANFVGATAAALGIYQGKRWGWVLGALIASSAFVSYFVNATIGLPGVVGHSELFEPVGIATKAVEALFLVLSGFKLAGFFAGGLGRWALPGGIAAVLVVPVLAVALGLLSPTNAQAGPGLPIKWKATSPATSLGDQYSLVVTNTSDKAQRVWVDAVMGHGGASQNESLVNEQLELAPGEERELTEINGYGDAMHVKTRLQSETQDLGLSVTLADSSGKETAQYNQEAFLVQQEGQRAREAKRPEAKLD